MRSRRDLVVSSRRLVGEICNISEISGEILTRSRRDSREMKDISARQTRSRRYERDFCEINESRQELGEICNFSEIVRRSRRDKRHLGEIKRSHQELCEICNVSEIGIFRPDRSPRDDRDLVEPKSHGVGGPQVGEIINYPLNWSNPPVHIISHFTR